MIFQHTWESVLSGRKSQTSRIWKDDYFFPSDYYDKTIYNHLLSLKSWDAGKPRTLYRVGQTLAVQPARGKKAIARIKVLELAKRDVRNFDALDIAYEGFDTRLDFYKVWVGMHFPAYLKLLEDNYVTSDWWLDATRGQVANHWTALVIRFELLP